ncbi:MAG: sulfatase/phosphatase domain-containing protein, partial [Phycisphaeraceae bacterium]
TGLDQNTIVIYSSDQGFYLGEHGWYDKRWVYEESLRTPLIVRWPGVVEPGTRNGDIVSPLDFAQTFLDIAGIDAPNDMQGESLVPIFKGNTPDDWRTSHYYHYYEMPGWHVVNRHYAVCTERYKLIRFYKNNHEEPGYDAWELIDLKVDPLETKNFYGDPAYAEIQDELHAELDRLRAKYKVPETDPAFLDKGRNGH